MIPGLEAEAQTILLLLLLIAAFVVAFKIMEMVFETILAAVMSAGFYLALVYFFNFPLSIERVLLFTFLGASLYMGYSFLMTAYSIASTVLEVPYLVIKPLLKFPYKAAKAALRKAKDYDRKQDFTPDTEEQDTGEEENSQDVKDVVLDKVRDKD